MKRFPLLRLLAAALCSTPWAFASEPGVSFDYTLKTPGYVTLVIENEEGARVRNLVAERWQEAGSHKQRWDGLDDTGTAVEAGTYRWRGLTHGGISTHFKGAFYSPGTPPWLTNETGAQRYIRQGGSGAWLSDHAGPHTLHAYGDRVYAGATIAEAGHSIMELDPEGRKQWGTLWLNLGGASAIFREGDTLYVASERGWTKDALLINRIHAKTHLWIPNPPETREARKDDPSWVRLPSAQWEGIRGLVVLPDQVLLSLADKGRIICFDKESGEPVREIPLPGAGALHLGRDGTLLAVSGKEIVKINPATGDREKVISTGLIEPSGLAVDSAGNIAVSDVAQEANVIRLFSPQGKLLRTIGKPGLRKEGRFDPMTFDHPRAIAIDEADRLWVAEESFYPKRITRWTLDGKLERDWTGPTYYGGGGALDPRNSRTAYYRGMRFDVATWPERSRLDALLFLPRDHADLPLSIGQEQLPQWPVYRKDRLYLVRDEGWGLGGVLIGEVEGDRMVPRIIFGSFKALREAWEEKHPDFIATLPESKAGTFLWQDLDRNGKAEPSEVTLAPEWAFNALWAIRSYPMLTLHAHSEEAFFTLEPDPEKPELFYDMAKARRIPKPPEVKGRAISGIAPDREGNLLINAGAGSNQGDPTNFFLSLAPDGKVRWRYPNPYPANWHNSPRPGPGEIQHTLNVEGFVAPSGEAGEVFQLNGNKGVRYLMTGDGLFIATLYGDMRSAPMFSSLSEAREGMRMDRHGLGDECFFGWLGQVEDGRIMQVIGKSAANVMEVHGLEAIHRLAGAPLHLTRPAPSREAAAEGPPPPVRVLQLGGIPTGWHKTRSREFPSSEPLCRFALAYTKEQLRLHAEVIKDGSMANGGDDPRTLFRSGDSVDFRIATRADAPKGRTTPAEGDYRILFTLYNGKPVAVRYRFVVPGVKDDARVRFASPTGVAYADEVIIDPKITVKIEPTATGYTLEAQIPWASLGLSEPLQGTFAGDVGVILSDPEGDRSVSRTYYFDQGSQVVSDIPSEARVNPSAWGPIEF